MSPANLVRMRGGPQLGPRMPTLALPAIIGVLNLGLSVVSYGLGTGIAIGIVLAVVSPWAPRQLGAWGAIVVIGAGQFTRHPSLNWRFFVLLAGLHLLHVLGTVTAGLPWRSWVQLTVFARPLLRFLAIQIPTQLLAGLALAVLAPDSHGHRPVSWPGFGLIGAVALAGLALLLAVPLGAERSRRG
jgi:hypothetical protein